MSHPGLAVVWNNGRGDFENFEPDATFVLADPQFVDPERWDFRLWAAGHRAADEVYKRVFDGVTADTGGAQHPRKEYRQAEGNVAIF